MLLARAFPLQVFSFGIQLNPKFTSLILFFIFYFLFFTQRSLKYLQRDKYFSQYGIQMHSSQSLVLR